MGRFQRVPGSINGTIRRLIESSESGAIWSAEGMLLHLQPFKAPSKQYVSTCLAKLCNAGYCKRVARNRYMRVERK